MAEHEEGHGGGGHGLSGTIDLPGIGPAKKKVVFAVVGAGGAYVLWRYWQSSRAGAADTAADPNADPYADPGTLPAVAGAVKADNAYGSADGGAAPSTDTYGFTGTTNSQWTQYATTQLTASDQWSYTQIVAALGQFLANKPLDSTQQQIVQAAIAVAGNPPEGAHVAVPGGDVPVTVAPGHLRSWDVTTDTQIGMQWDPVAGASHYRIFRSDLGSEPVGDSQDTKFWARGLTPHKSYSFQVAAVSASGKVGPKSSAYKSTTKSVTLAKPGTPRVTAITRSGAHVSVTGVKGATGYLWYINGSERGHSDAPSQTLSGLKANTTYRIAVKADTATQAPGPLSGTATFKTKK